MSEMNNGGPAFPQSDLSGYGIGPVDGMAGMSLRDWFAGQALAGWLASYGPDAGHPANRPGSRETVARQAYEIADAMIAEREKTR